MTIDPHRRERLVARILAAEEESAPDRATPHPDDDTLALFAEGRLAGREHETVVAHLADCGSCRQQAGLLLAAAGAEEEPVRPPRSLPWLRRWPIQLLALAAGVVICVSLFALYDSRRDQLAEGAAYDEARAQLVSGQFEAARATLAEAQAQRIRSPRLDNLAAQALRRIPCSIAFAAQGKLTELGVGIGGIIARAPPADDAAATSAAARLLADAAPADLEAALNESHLLLARNEPQQALDRLHPLVTRHPDNAWIWLGLGNAHYLLADYPAAIAAYRQCLQLAPDTATARLNLAMAYEESNQPAAALAAWEQLLTDHAGSLGADERRQVEAQIKALRESPQQAP